VETDGNAVRDRERTRGGEGSRRLRQGAWQEGDDRYGQPFGKIGLLKDIKGSLEAAGVSFALYDKVVAEPTMEYTEEGLKVFKEAQAELLIAVGGGSPIDAAKAIAALARNPGKMSDFIGANKIPQMGAPMIAIPTTAGTGSEVTQFTIITDTEKNVKNADR
jgi:alcohol dehydrogenase class IV